MFHRSTQLALLVHLTTVLRVTFPHERKYVVSNDTLREADLAIAEVVCGQHLYDSVSVPDEVSERCHKRRLDGEMTTRQMNRSKHQIVKGQTQKDANSQIHFRLNTSTSSSVISGCSRIIAGPMTSKLSIKRLCHSRSVRA